jgi:hypothetical protein
MPLVFPSDKGEYETFRIIGLFAGRTRPHWPSRKAGLEIGWPLSRLDSRPPGTLGAEPKMQQADLETGKIDRQQEEARLAALMATRDSRYPARVQLRRDYPAGRRVLPGRFGRARLCRREPHLDQVVLGPASSRVAPQELHLRYGAGGRRPGGGLRILPKPPRWAPAARSRQLEATFLRRAPVRSFDGKSWEYDHLLPRASSRPDAGRAAHAGEPCRYGRQPVGTAQAAQERSPETAAQVARCQGPHRLAAQADLRHALDQRQFVLYYQPEVELSTRKIVGLEALIRWATPSGGSSRPWTSFRWPRESG